MTYAAWKVQATDYAPKIAPTSSPIPHALLYNMTMTFLPPRGGSYLSFPWNWWACDYGGSNAM